MAERPISSILTHFGVLLASSLHLAFLIVLIYAALWFVFEREHSTARHRNLGDMANDASHPAIRAP